ncbi:MAG: hypothetical protein ACR2Q3_12720 [Woeseiaceae bacterium]
MFMETPDTLLYVAGGAFLLGWLVGKIGAYLGNRFQARRRDPRDDRIRNLDAELRIAQTNSDKAQESVERLKNQLTDQKELVEKRDDLITEQQQLVAELRRDLKDSVMKTRELRAELSNRAAENVKSEVKLREVETELSVAQASTDLLATGVLDYSVAPDGEEDDENGQGDQMTAVT